MNSTSLCLVSKYEQLEDVTQFRPIACCNVLYKIISKMICSRLTEILPSLVNQVQSAFVQNRVIFHNIFLCQDIMKQYRRRNGPARCTVKVDLRKAYDSIHWEFIRDLLVQLEFPQKFIDWSMLCVTTPSFTLNTNGSSCGFFQGKKGLRHGDPMSPLMEYLTRLMSIMSRKAEFSFHHRCAPLRISHMIFADDLMLFCKGDVKFAILMKRTMHAFSEISGLQASQEKAAVYFGNVKEEVASRILQVTGYKRGEFPFRYLGMPITARKLTTTDCDVVVDKMLRRITCWSSRHLPYAARVTLVNVVLISLHTFWAQLFILPKTVIQRIIQVCRAFLWEGKEYLHRRPHISWDKVCTTKKNGGLGIRDCLTWGAGIMEKYVWQVAQKEDLLWIKWVHTMYFQDSN